MLPNFLLEVMLFDQYLNVCLKKVNACPDVIFSISGNRHKPTALLPMITRQSITPPR